MSLAVIKFIFSLKIYHWLLKIGVNATAVTCSSNDGPHRELKFI
jgi:hypothetical protein